VAAAELHDLDLQLAHPQRHPLLEHDRRPGQARDRLDRAEQPREALDLALHVGFAALDDEVVGVAAGDHVLRLVAGGAEHAHRVVVGQRHVPDRLVGHRADVPDHVLRHHRGGLRVDHHHGVVADDDAGVRVALGRVRIGVIGELVEADPLLFQVGLGCELLFHVDSSSVSAAKDGEYSRPAQGEARPHAIRSTRHAW
jgi:hypothetical protein